MQATFLRVLATKPGITVAGTVTDRVGRRGVAVTARTDGDEPQQLTLIVDPDTGALLGEEDLWLDQGPDDLVETGFTTWLETARVAAIGDHP